MTSSARLSANRKNAKRSTGPRSKEGKKVVARNALRHGLAIPIDALPQYDPAIARLTKILAGPGAGSERRDLARQVAEAEFDVIRVRRARIALLQVPLVEELHEQPRCSPNSDVETLLRLAKLVLDPGGDPFRDEQAKAVRRRIDSPIKLGEPRPEPVKLDGNEHFAAVIAARSSELQRIDRYERRALSRRKQAIRALDDLSGAN